MQGGRASAAARAARIWHGDPCPQNGGLSEPHLGLATVTADVESHMRLRSSGQDPESRLCRRGCSRGRREAWEQVPDPWSLRRRGTGPVTPPREWRNPDWRAGSKTATTREREKIGKLGARTGRRSAPPEKAHGMKLRRRREPGREWMPGWNADFQDSMWSGVVGGRIGSGLFAASRFTDTFIAR